MAEVQNVRKAGLVRSELFDKMPRYLGAKMLFKVDLEGTWWRDWWDEDYSWEGLARKPVGKNGTVIHGGIGGVVNLQDYWRRDPVSGQARDDATLIAAGELEALDGAVFHIAHVPRRNRAGVGTWKADLLHAKWVSLELLINTRCGHSLQTTVGYRGLAEGVDGRVQLAGAVLRKAPYSATHLNIEASRSAYLCAADFSGQVFGKGARLPHAFLTSASFDDAKFLGDVDFCNTIFNGYVRFVNSRFDGETFFDTAKFRGLAAFENALLHPATTFDRAKFEALDKVASRCQLTMGTFVAMAILVATFGLQLALPLKFFAYICILGLIALSVFWLVFGGDVVAKSLRVDLERQGRAFRALAHHMEIGRNRSDRARFYRLELLATRLRRETNLFERLISAFYDLCAKYGESILRPVFCLGILVGAFAALFWLPSGDAGDFAHSVRYSILNVVRPMHVWTVDFTNATSQLSQSDPYWRWVSRSFSNIDPLVQLGLRVLASIQSLLAIALVFLGALAIRRKFQID